MAALRFVCRLCLGNSQIRAIAHPLYDMVQRYSVACVRCGQMGLYKQTVQSALMMINPGGRDDGVVLMFHGRTNFPFVPPFGAGPWTQVPRDKEAKG